MRKIVNLKLLRKFLILAVLTGGLFMVASSNQISAEGCCSDCEIANDACVAACYNPNPDKWKQCIHAECHGPYWYCLSHCDMGC